MNLLRTLALGLLLLPGLDRAAEAATVPITGGTTTVDLTAPLGTLGLSALAFGSGSFDGSTFTFPITGGSSDTVTGETSIEHAGSGVGLFSGTVLAIVSDFVIEIPAGIVTGRINAGSTSVTLFEFGTPSGAGIPLLISSDLAAALTAVFTAPDLTGVEFGIANTSPIAAISLPAALPLLAGGIGLIALGRVRHRRPARR